MITYHALTRYHTADGDPRVTLHTVKAPDIGNAVRQVEAEMAIYPEARITMISETTR